MTYTEWHFKVLNALVRRVLAPGFIIVGTILTLYGVRYLMPGATINVNGVPSDDLLMRIVGVAMPLSAVALGVLLFRAKPFKWPNQT
jgi:hypothetical protein